MEPSQQRKRGSGWSQSDLLDALDDVKNNRLSERGAAIKYNIPRRTLKNHKIWEPGEEAGEESRVY